MAYGNVNSPGVTVSEVAAEIAKALESYILASQKGAANGVASLDALGKVLKEQIPALEYIAKNARGTANGVASLDGNGKVPVAQIPALSYLPTSQKGAANGVASLDANGDVPLAQMPPYLLYGAGAVGPTTDWNTLPPGAYKVDINLGSGAGAPSGLYRYGSLLHYCGIGAVGGTQVYVPHIGTAFALRTRYEPGAQFIGGWTAWRYFNVCGASAAIATAPNNTSYTTKQVRNITLSTAAASGGGNGDLFFTYM